MNLTHDQLVVACRNIGLDLRCGACASRFFTGHAMDNHDAGCASNRPTDSKVRLWRYVLPSIRWEGWAIIILGSDGYFSAVSDFGNYAYRWTAHGCRDFREFILGIGVDYLVSKISPGTEYSGECTHQRIVEEIIRRRREGSAYGNARRPRGLFGKSEAREEYELLRDSDVQGGSILEFAEWMKETRLNDQGEAYELAVYRSDPQAVAFCEKVIPRLQELIRREIRSQEIVHA